MNVLHIFRLLLSVFFISYLQSTMALVASNNRIFSIVSVLVPGVVAEDDGAGAVVVALEGVDPEGVLRGVDDVEGVAAAGGAFADSSALLHPLSASPTSSDAASAVKREAGRILHGGRIFMMSSRTVFSICGCRL